MAKKPNAKKAASDRMLAAVNELNAALVAFDEVGLGALIGPILDAETGALIRFKVTIVERIAATK